MSRGINKVILVGNLGADPDVRYTPAGSPVTKFNVATSDSWQDRQTEQKRERTEWHRIVCFGRLAEITGEYLRKGSKVYIEGSLRTDSWEGQDGVKRWTTEIIAREMQMLDSKGSGPRPQEDDYGPPPDSKSYNSGLYPGTQDDSPGKSRTRKPQTGEAPLSDKASDDDLDDDIPF